MRLSGDFRHFLLARGIEPVPQDDRIEGIKISPHQNLWAVGFSWSHHFARSANRARLNRQPSLRHCVEMTDHNQPLVLNKPNQNAQAGQNLYVDNIGSVSDQFQQVSAISFNKFTWRWMRVNRISRERDHLMLHETSVTSESPWFSAQRRAVATFHTAERFGLIRKGLRWDGNRNT